MSDIDAIRNEHLRHSEECSCVDELHLYARSLEAELTRLRAVEEAARRVDHWADKEADKHEPLVALRAALREKGAESE